jgi:O-antigen ligase
MGAQSTKVARGKGPPFRVGGLSRKPKGPFDLSRRVPYAPTVDRTATAGPLAISTVSEPIPNPPAGPTSRLLSVVRDAAAVWAPSAEPGARRPRIAAFARVVYALHLLTIGALAISNVLLGLSILAALAAGAYRRVAWHRLRPIFVPSALYVVLLLAAIVASSEPRQSLGSASEIFSLATLFLAPLLLRTAAQRRSLADGVAAMVGVVAAWGLLQLAGGARGIDHRITGPFSHWMTFAGVLLVGDFLLAARLVVDRASRRHLWRWAALAAINLSLLASLTRSAWVAGALTAAVFLAVQRPRWLAGLGVAALLTYLLAPVSLAARIRSLADPRDPSNYDRLCMLDAGLHMIGERPLFGIGPDMVRERYSIYRHPSAPRWEIPHLHNDLLELAAERGLAAAATYLWLMVAAIVLALRRYRREGGERGPNAGLYLGAVLALVAFNLAGCFEFNWGDVEVQRLALFLLAVPLAALGENDEKDEGGGAEPSH